jgi:undecaprenyl-diphosphatase
MSSASVRPRARLLRLVGVSASAFVFAVLLILVRTQWPPLESLDHGLATDLNNGVSNHTLAVRVANVITWFGSNGVLWSVVLAGAVITGVRRRYRLAIYLLIAGGGALVLDPVLKALVGRVRPVVPHPVSYGTGNSFPSGHSLGSIICYGALLLVFLPAVAPRFRTLSTIAVGVLVAAIGISRVVLGVHYLSDVVGAWAVGVAWLGLTAFAFELMREQSSQRVTRPLAEGLEPEAAGDLVSADPQPLPRHHLGRTAAGVVVAWVLILGIVVGIGELVVKYGGGDIAGDHSIPHWFAVHRSATWTWWSEVFSALGGTQMILIAAVATCVVALAVTRRWWPVMFIVTLMVGELGQFLAAAAIVKRPRPDVVQLDPHLPTSAFPSGHVAATCCVYAGAAVLVIGHARGWWRWLFLIPAIAMPILVATSRIYRGEHHPTDVVGSFIFAALWIPAVYLLIRPSIWRAVDDVAGRHADAAVARPRSGEVRGVGNRAPAESDGGARHPAVDKRQSERAARPDGNDAAPLSHGKLPLSQ